jgi:hypothetical protein
MSNQIARLFTDHPQSVDETYFEHLRFLPASFRPSCLLPGSPR